GVAGPLAESVDRDLDLSRAGLDGGQGIRRRQPEVVVAVDADGRIAADKVDDPPGQGTELGRDRVPDRVRDVDRGRTRLDDRLVDLEEVVDVSSRRVLGREFDLGVSAQSLTAVADPANRLGERRLPVDSQLVLAMDI